MVRRLSMLRDRPTAGAVSGGAGSPFHARRRLWGLRARGTVLVARWSRRRVLRRRSLEARADCRGPGADHRRRSGPVASRIVGSGRDSVQPQNPENPGIQLVGTTGGAPSKLPIDGAVFDPQWLPDGRHFLYINGDRDPARIFAASIDGRQAPVAVQELDQAVTASGGDPGFRYSDAATSCSITPAC